MLKEIEFFLNECENIKRNYMSMFKNQKKCEKKRIKEERRYSYIFLIESDVA